MRPTGRNLGVQEEELGPFVTLVLEVRSHWKFLHKPLLGGAQIYVDRTSVTNRQIKSSTTNSNSPANKATSVM